MTLASSSTSSLRQFIAASILCLSPVVIGLSSGAAIAQTSTPFRLAALPERLTQQSPITIGQAEVLLVENNPDLRIALSALEQARADVSVAQQKPNPQFTTGIGSINPSRGIGPGGPLRKTVDSSVRLDQLLERGNKASLRVEAAQRSGSAAEFDVGDAFRQQRIAMRSAFYDVMAAQELVNLLNQNVASYDASVTAAQKRLSAGDISGADVARLRVDRLRAINDANQAQLDLARARQGLAFLLGITTNTNDLVVNGAWAPNLQSYVMDINDALLESRPDVRAAQQRVVASELQRDLAVAQRTRDVSVGAQFDHYPVSAFNTSGTGNTISVSLSIPLFLKHRFEGSIRRAEADVDAAKVTLERTIAAARTESQQLVAAMQIANERNQRYINELLPESRRALRAAEFAFTNGAMPVMDYLDAKRVQFAIQSDAVQAQSDLTKAVDAWAISSRQLPPPVPLAMTLGKP